jgi:hypothetical protein
VVAGQLLSVLSDLAAGLSPILPGGSVSAAASPADSSCVLDGWRMRRRSLAQKSLCC